jgi:hypothetical protein
LHAIQVFELVSKYSDCAVSQLVQKTAVTIQSKQLGSQSVHKPASKNFPVKQVLHDTPSRQVSHTAKQSKHPPNPSSYYVVRHCDCA